MRAKMIVLLFCVALFLSACGHLHDFGNWVTAQEATCTVDGQRYHVCYTCGETVYEIIPAAHEYVEGICCVCGDGAAPAPVTTASAEVTFHYPGTSALAAATTTGAVTTTTTTIVTTRPTTATTSVATTTRTTAADTPEWTLTEVQTAVTAIQRAFLAAQTANNHLTAAKSTPVQHAAAVALAQAEMASAKSQLETALTLLRQNEPLPAIEDTTAVAHTEAAVALCATVLAVTDGPAHYGEITQATVDVIAHCSATQKCLLDWMNHRND